MATGVLRSLAVTSLDGFGLRTVFLIVTRMATTSKADVHSTNARFSRGTK